MPILHSNKTHPIFVMEMGEKETSYERYKTDYKAKSLKVIIDFLKFPKKFF